ncbi:MAG: glycosyltransferase family 2 protein [Paludibacteraceae bacterium]|nr:glycosyltransferase family 2 protein [Paludibacteraceae bacterium]
MTSFKIYSLLLVKNEADIIRESLLAAAEWSDKVIVMDNGSEDGTWEIVQQLALTNPRIVPFMQYKGAFHIGLRAKAFKAFRHEMSSKDWWCVRLDADEFFRDNPREFLAKLPKRYSVVKKQSTDYVLTHEDVEAGFLTGDFAKDRDFIVHYLPEKRKERRFMRHRSCLFWHASWRYPHPMGCTAPQCISVDHYQYRSPQQMQGRFSTRQQAKHDGCGSFLHENGTDWTDYLWTNQILEEQTSLMNNLSEQFAQSTDVLYQKRNTIKRIGQHFVVKSFALPSWWKRIIYSISPSKARRSFIYAQRLGSITPKPVAYKETRKAGILHESYYISRVSPCTHVLKEVIKNKEFPQRMRIFADFGRFTAALHEQGILHADYSMGNVLFEPSETDTCFQLVDLNRMRFKQRINCRKGCRNFERIDTDHEALSVMARAYAQARGYNEEECVRLVLKMRWRKHKK